MIVSAAPRAAGRWPNRLDIGAEFAAVEEHEIDAVEIERGVLFVLLFDREAQAVAVEASDFCRSSTGNVTHEIAAGMPHLPMDALCVSEGQE